MTADQAVLKNNTLVNTAGEWNFTNKSMNESQQFHSFSLNVQSG